MAALAPPASCLVYTPRILADAMVASLASPDNISWLEPGCGQGVFLQAMSALGITKSQIQAIDLDPTPSENDSYANVIRGVDFLNWAREQEARFDCIVANPPYVAIRILPKSLQSAAAEVRDHQGSTIGRRANTWYAFLQCSLQLLNDGGNLAFVLPAACEYADYCRPGRQSITNLFERVDLIRSQRPLFPDVQEGAVVLVCRNKREGDGVFRRHDVADLQETIERLHRLTDHKARRCPPQTSQDKRRLIRLGDVLSIKLGGVTGDADYFTISEQRRCELGLPLASVLPIVSRCRHIRRPCMNRDDWTRLKKQNERVWLFNPSKSAAENLAVRRYLRLPEERGGCRRTGFKVRNRDPWYCTRLPETPHGFISGMSPHGIWICFNEMRRLNATNTLYAVRFRKDLSNNERYSCALSLLTSIVSRSLRRLRRRYADGLEKIEPGQLADLPIPYKSVPGAKSKYRRALSFLWQGNAQAARQIADFTFLSD